MTIEDQAPDSLRQDSGYGPELKRTLGSFQVFAISFAFISVAVGVFGTYDDVLQNSGPVGIWLWVLAAAGQMLIALVVAQFAARIALSARPTSGPRGWPIRRSAGGSAGCPSATSPSARWLPTAPWRARPSCRCSGWRRTRMSRG